MIARMLASPPLRMGPHGRIARLPATLSLAAALWLWIVAPAAQGVEFASPPGINVERQEEQLKAEVTRNAKDLVGDNLIDVIVHVGYARTETKDSKGETPARIKLPGFNRFITADAQNRLELRPEFVRMRQIFVIVSDNLESDVDSIKRELTSLGRFDRKKGDMLRVLTVGGARSDLGAAGEKGKRPPLLKRRKKRRFGSPANEPESTLHLLRARTAYFKEDYNRTLDHILKAITVEPNNAQAYAMLGSLYFTINWKNLAIKYWEKSLEFDPENTELEDLVAEVKNG